MTLREPDSAETMVGLIETEPDSVVMMAEQMVRNSAEQIWKAEVTALQI